jgi:TPR repeat protein
MTGSSMWPSLGASLSSLGVPNAASVATDYAAKVFGCEPGVRSRDSTNGQTPGRNAALCADVRADREEERAPGPGTLPEGFVPICEAKNMAVLGRWPLLDDKMPPCLPLNLLLSMQLLCEDGDPSAAAWMKIYERAFSGAVEAQRAFGKVCETGVFGAPVDLQRAYFWYYRAALQGDVEARYSAERVARSIHVSSAATAEPALVYSGAWRITADVPGARGATSFFELSEMGAASGWMIGNMGHHAQAKNIALNAQYNGQWAYDRERKMLTFDFSASVTAASGRGSDIWQIELLGCRSGAVFGRDRRMVSYILEHAGAA